jgi:4'-phosphopantetheinyl transferase
MLQVFFTRFETPFDRAFIEAQVKLFPEQIQKDILAFRRDEDATASLLGKLLLEDGMRRLGIPLNWEYFALTSKDKPFFQNGPEFNISHSGKIVVCAIASEPIGIDIEKIRTIKIDHFNRQFSEKEWEIINSAENKVQQFFEFWAIKEAAIKADGRGMEMVSKTEILSETELKMEEKKLFYRQLSLAPNYKGAIAVFEKKLLEGRIILEEVAVEKLVGRINLHKKTN